MGGALAIYIAQKYKIRGLILENTFVSAKQMILRHFPKYMHWMRWAITKLEFKTVEMIRRVVCPILFFSCI